MIEQFEKLEPTPEEVGEATNAYMALITLMEKVEENGRNIVTMFDDTSGRLDDIEQGLGDILNHFNIDSSVGHPSQDFDDEEEEDAQADAEEEGHEEDEIDQLWGDLEDGTDDAGADAPPPGYDPDKDSH